MPMAPHAAERPSVVSRLLEGVPLAEMCTATCRATVEVADWSDQEIAHALEQYRVASADPFNVDGTPKVMKVVTWMAHADVVNRNKDMFVAEELQALVPSLWRLPNPGVMDWNHSAVLPNKGPKVIGFWYKADWAFDNAADDGKGAWGIIATGLMFAWAFPDIAAKMLAKQEEQGYVDFSAAWIPAVRETKRGGPSGRYTISHNPTFFTLSALDVAPADPDASGPVTLDPAVTEEELQATLETTTPEVVAARAQEDGTMNEATKEPVAEPVAEPVTASQEAAAAETTETTVPATELAATPEVGVAEVVMVEVTQTQTTRTEEVDGQPTYQQVVEQLTTYKTTIAELQAANKTLAATAAEAATKIATLEAQLLEFQQKESERAREAVLASRIASLPAEFVKAFEKKDPEVKAKARMKWATMTDEEWVDHLELLNIPAGQMKVGYVERSAAEGDLPAGGQGEGSVVDTVLSRHLKKTK